MKAIAEILGDVYAGEFDDTEALNRLGALPKEDLADFILDIYNRGWITNWNLGLDGDGRLI